MELFSRLWLSANTKSVEQPPTDVFAALIDDLYAPLASFMIGAATSAAVCGITAWRTGSAVADGPDGWYNGGRGRARWLITHRLP